MSNQKLQWKDEVPTKFSIVSKTEGVKYNYKIVSPINTDVYRVEIGGNTKKPDDSARHPQEFKTLAEAKAWIETVESDHPRKEEVKVGKGDVIYQLFLKHYHGNDEEHHLISTSAEEATCKKIINDVAYYDRAYANLTAVEKDSLDVNDYNSRHPLIGWQDELSAGENFTDNLDSLEGNTWASAMYISEVTLS